MYRLLHIILLANTFLINSLLNSNSRGLMSITLDSKQKYWVAKQCQAILTENLSIANNLHEWTKENLSFTIKYIYWELNANTCIYCFSYKTVHKSQNLFKIVLNEASAVISVSKHYWKIIHSILTKKTLINWCTHTVLARKHYQHNIPS